MGWRSRTALAPVPVIRCHGHLASSGCTSCLLRVRQDITATTTRKADAAMADATMADPLEGWPKVMLPISSIRWPMHRFTHMLLHSEQPALWERMLARVQLRK